MALLALIDELHIQLSLIIHFIACLEKNLDIGINKLSNQSVEYDA